MTLRGYWWAVAVIAGAGQLLTMGLVTAGIASASISSAEAGDLQGQQLLVASLSQGILDQEVGIGAYASSGDPQQLAPYTRGSRQAEAALQRLTLETAGTPRAVQVALVVSAVGDWQRWAEGLRVRVASSRRPVRDAAAEQEGERLLTRLTAVVTELESELDAARGATAAGLASAWRFALTALWVGSVLVAAALALGTARAVDRSVGLAQGLAEAAREIARGGVARIPYAERPDEIGELAKALQAWQRAAAEREIVIRQAPMGICQLDTQRNLVAVSPAFARMLDLPLEQVEGRPLRSFVHPDDLDRERGTPLAGMIAGREDRVAMEHRLVRADGSVLWCSVTFAAVRGPDGLLEGFVGVFEDISERRQQTERAAQIQRELLPQTTPLLEGYDLAGACRPAQDVAGDFYDWKLQEDGQLDLTVADVMGKGLGSGLVMATVRAVLRAASPGLRPAARVRLAAEFLPRAAEDDGLFVTLFQGRLDLATGVLRYVDAGHGYGVVRRAGGELVHLSERSLPLGIWPDQEFAEGTVRLEPGDTLIVHSDGLVETEERTGDLSEYAGELDDGADAQELVWRLMRWLPSRPVRLHDDITVVALRRAPQPSATWPAEATSPWLAAAGQVGSGPRSGQGDPAGRPPSESEAPRSEPKSPVQVPDAGATAGAGGRLLGFLPARTQRQGVRAGTIFGVTLHLLLVGLVSAGILVGTAGSGKTASLRSQQLLASGLRQDMLEQEAGIGAYASSGDPRPLAPYAQGRKDMDAALGRLRQHAAGTPRAKQVALVGSAAEDWQRWAEGIRARVASSRGPVSDASAAQEGERLLGTFTTALGSLEAELEGALATAATDEARGRNFALGALLAGSLVVGTLTGLGISSQLASGALGSLASLALVAREIARGGQVEIPDAGRSDEFGELARALQAWHSASAARGIMIEQAPLGIGRLDRTGRIAEANAALYAMLGYSASSILGRPLLDLVHAEDRQAPASFARSLADGSLDDAQAENRFIRGDGSLLWCSVIVAALRGTDGQPEGFEVIVEDISERRQQTERAGEIQRELLPQTTPLLEGYDLAGACRPAQDVAGDFYDWKLQEDGQLDLTVADVMGKGLGSGLVMATVRAVLRAAPPELGPAARVRLAAEFLPGGTEDDGLFVTLFHGRLDLATGVLRYVDAGHGYGVVRRAGGELVRLGQRSLPLGIWPDQEFAEGTVRLERGETLIVHSDGLVETEDRTGDLSEYAGELDDGADAQELVWRLMRHLPDQLHDDVTVLALRRASVPDPLVVAFESADQLIGQTGPQGREPSRSRFDRGLMSSQTYISTFE